MKNNKLVIILSLALAYIIFLLFNLKSSSEEPMRVEPKLKDTVVIKQDTFSEANLILALYELEIEEPEIVLNQAKLETGNFKSYLFKKSNNLFGFRNFNGYKVYKNWKCSVIAYKQWQSKKYKGGNYYTFLKNIGYAEDSLYIKKLKQFK